MFDANGDVLPASSSSSTTAAAAAAAPITVDDNDAEDDAAAASGDEAEDEYEIEHIVSHFHDSADNQLSYFVKWKGYPESENTWVYESDMGGAQEMIAEYWAKAPEKRVKKMGTKGGKRGKRQSSVAASPAAKASSSALTAAGKRSSRRESSIAGERKTRAGRSVDQHSRSPTPDDTLIDAEHDPALQRIRSDPSLTDEERALLEAQHLRTITIDRLRKRYARIADWDPIVKKIEAVEKMSDNKLRVFLHFENGDRLAFESVVAHHRCPLKLLAFYESNLRFKRGEEGDQGRREMKGDEATSELDAYTARQPDESKEVVEADGHAVAVKRQHRTPNPLPRPTNPNRSQQQR